MMVSEKKETNMIFALAKYSLMITSEDNIAHDLRPEASQVIKTGDL